uniref:Uncharacterized protein n=1 Tax=Nelumbo nucifera TaxID=4432 RepID=A0A822XIA5_NELNU|nr:TPA_asm: hypothetical protein HUJ06_021420 [Nelumbo nucifera]
MQNSIVRFNSFAQRSEYHLQKTYGHQRCIGHSSNLPRIRFNAVAKFVRKSISMQCSFNGPGSSKHALSRSLEMKP